MRHQASHIIIGLLLLGAGRAAAQSAFPTRDHTFHLGLTAGSVSFGSGTDGEKARFGVTLGVESSVRLTDLIRLSAGAELMQGGVRIPTVATVFPSGPTPKNVDVDQVWGLDYLE